MDTPNEKSHVVLLPSPGLGHLIPFTELANRLVLHHNLTATIITFSDLSSPAQQSLLSSLPAGVSSTTLPPIPLPDLPPTAHIVTRLSHMISRSLPAIKQILQKLHEEFNNGVAAYITDQFGGDTLSAAADLAVPRHVFFTTSLFYVSFFLTIPALFEEPGDFPDKFLLLPGCVPLHPKDFSRSATDKRSEVFSWMVRHAKHLDKVDGIMVNSFEAMESSTFKFLNERANGSPPIFPIGPLTSDHDSKSRGDSNSCIQWLDEQPDRSVLFITFGSGGTLSFQQTAEIALGLEMSGHRFLWVVRPPVDGNASSSFFSTAQHKNNVGCFEGNNNNDHLGFLPEGFVGRTEKKGMVVPFWAPQAKILAHSAVGGFLSHCGWNSTLESIVNGVPMIAWPLYSEQPMNAVMLVDGLQVAVRPTVARNEGLVTRDEIAEAVEDLMAGEGGKGVGRRMLELKEEALKAVGEDGSSYKALSNIVKHWKKSI